MAFDEEFLEPPAYAESAEQSQEPLDVRTAFANLDLPNAARTPAVLPSVDQCIAHLELLEAFHQLKEEISNTDGLFGLDDSDIPKSLAPNDIEELRAKLAQKRWAVYLARAVDRFARWWTVALPSRTQDFFKMTELGWHDPSEGILSRPVTAKCTFTRDNLPPLDVLMVWHAYMLNPRRFLEDCTRQSKMFFWNTGMPWKAVSESIDHHTFEYITGNGARASWESKTGLAWDNIHDDSGKRIVCVRCQSHIEVPWTTCGDELHQSANQLTNVIAIRQVIEGRGLGYADKYMEAGCQCGAIHTHDVLRVQQFLFDLDLLMRYDVPMPGTILSCEDVPARFLTRSRDKYPILSNYHGLFINRLLKLGLGETLQPRLATVLPIDQASIFTVRDEIELGLKDKQLIGRATDMKHGICLTLNTRRAIRTMMSCYWENSSHFALDLVGAVARQSTFISKMHNIDWLHSPALQGTMARLIIKYTRFMQILENRQHMAVPTLDVDLAWHTHQLSPYTYFTYTVKNTGTLIDHDDKVAETQLHDAFAWTSKTYQKLFGEPYSECTCWYCEAVRENHTSSVSRFLGTSSAAVNESLRGGWRTRGVPPDDAGKGPHISAHNAVRPARDNADYTSNLWERIRKDQLIALETGYEKACKHAIKKGRTPPSRPQDYLGDDQNLPFMVDPDVRASRGMYAANPACMSMMPGAAGNCARGTCGGGAAAGSCAGVIGVRGGVAGVSGGCAGGGSDGGGGGGCGGGGGS